MVSTQKSSFFSWYHLTGISTYWTTGKELCCLLLFEQFRFVFLWKQGRDIIASQQYGKEFTIGYAYSLYIQLTNPDVGLSFLPQSSAQGCLFRQVHSLWCTNQDILSSYLSSHVKESTQVQGNYLHPLKGSKCYDKNVFFQKSP